MRARSVVEESCIVDVSGAAILLLDAGVIEHPSRAGSGHDSHRLRCVGATM